MISSPNYALVSSNELGYDVGRTDRKLIDDGYLTMLGPTVVFAFVVATLIGAVFHLVVGGDARRLALFLLAAWIGFALGQMAGQSLGIEQFAIGSLRIVPAALGALFTLIVATIFTAGRRPSAPR